MTQNVLGSKERGAVFVVSGPAGAGKNTLVDMLVAEYPCVVESISCTTRSPRPHEIDGVHYYFLSEEKFEEKIKNGEFLEYANVFGNYYGTRAASVEEQCSQGNHVVLVIDVQGAHEIMKRLKAVFIFVMPPSFEELRRRIVARATETRDDIERRLAKAEEEMSALRDYDYVVVNEDVKSAYEILKSIVVAEEHRVER